MTNQSPTLLRLIAIFKLVKAALLIMLAIGSLKMMHKDIGDAIQQWVEMLGINSDGRLISHAIERASALTPQKIKLLSIGSLLYAGLFITEGVGLWLLKRWAEWFTIIITSSLVPLEIYEIHRHPTPLKFAVLAINIAIVIYLIWRVRQNPSK